MNPLIKWALAPEVLRTEGAEFLYLAERMFEVDNPDWGWFRLLQWATLRGGGKEWWL